MRRLVDGAYAVVSKAPWDSQVRLVNHARRLEVPHHQAQQLLALAHGVPDCEPAPELFAALQQAGLADAGLDAVDAVVHERLADLGRGYAWHLGGHRDGAELAALLRRAHARRKVSFFHFGQTACLPESGATRCVEMTRRMGEAQRVLLVGDDDLLCLPLARLGHRVSVVDIDPLLVGFLRRAAADEGLDIDARVQDVLAPWPADLVGAFDACITDPMSYEGCLAAFLSRAAVAVREGGAIFSCVHPLARELFSRVCWGLPVDVEETLCELSTYYYEGFIENWYRSDMYVLRRGGGEPRWSAADSIPLGNIIAGSLKERAHGFTDISCLPFRRPTREGVSAALDEFARHAGGLVVDRHDRHDEHWAHFFLALKDGGHVSVVLDRAKGTLAYDLYPYSRELDGAVTAAFTRTLSLARTLTFHREAPDLASPTAAPRRR